MSGNGNGKRGEKSLRGNEGNLAAMGLWRFLGNVMKDISDRTVTVIFRDKTYFLAKENKTLCSEGKQKVEGAH